jgi:acetyl esterase/lipase
MRNARLAWFLAVMLNFSGARAAEVEKAAPKKPQPTAKPPTPLDPDKLKAIEQIKARAAAKEVSRNDAAQNPEAAKPGTRGSLGVRETIYDYKTVAGRALKAYVYTPAGDKIRPVLILLHPGGLISGEARMQMSDNDKPIQGKSKFFEAGFTIVSLEYRLAPTATLDQIVADVVDGHRWVYEKGPELLNIDDTKIGFIGNSAGGYLSLVAGYSVTPRPRFIIAVSGYGDVTADWYAKPDPYYRRSKSLVTEKQAMRPGAGGDLYLYCRQNGLWPKIVGGHDPVTEKDWFKPYCPVRNVTSDFPPTMLVHGDEDTDVPYQESERMAAELAKHGVEHEFMLNRGAGHGMLAIPPGPDYNKNYQRLVDFGIEHVN